MNATTATSPISPTLAGWLREAYYGGNGRHAVAGAVLHVSLRATAWNQTKFLMLANLAEAKGATKDDILDAIAAG